MTNYRRGAFVERKCIEVLEADGYICVRSAGSHSPWDVSAVRYDRARFVQVKRATTLKLAAHQLDTGREEISRIQVPCHDTREVWVWLDRQSWYAKEVV